LTEDSLKVDLDRILIVLCQSKFISKFKTNLTDFVENTYE